MGLREPARFCKERKKMTIIENIPHEVAADMQMAYSEDELDAHMEVISNSDVVPKMLNDDSLSAGDIQYNGDLKKKDLEGFAKTFDDTEFNPNEK